jgi:hypothetical protein
MVSYNLNVENNSVASNLNHSITPDIKLNMSEGKQIRWFLPGGKSHLFLAKFSSIDKANQFKAAFEKCILGKIYLFETFALFKVLLIHNLHTVSQTF